MESWLAEYRALEKPQGDAARVMVQDGEDGANTGLVVFRLGQAPTGVYIQPADQDPTKWVATMEAREENLVLDPAGLLGLSAELAAVSELCAFLEQKSQAYRGIDVA
ncbi:hypothetical protein [Microbacterium sp. HJ5]